MISNDLVLGTPIPLLDLIYGEMKIRMYQAQCALEDLSEDSIQAQYMEGLLDAYGFVYTEIDRIMNLRGVK